MTQGQVRVMVKVDQNIKNDCPNDLYFADR